ncbi:hypothetical protein D3C81_725830 [compost metagenome]
MHQLFLMSGSRQREQCADDPRLQMDVHAHHDVFQHGHATEQANVLERPGNSQAHDLMGFDANDGRSIQFNRTFVRSINAGNHVKKRRFPGPVRTDHGGNLAARERKVNASNRR